MVTFLFAGDGSLASEGLSVFLQTKSNFLMISECHDGATAVADIEAHTPEIAVIDAQLPDMTAGQIIERVRARNQQTKIIVLGHTADRNVADRLLTAGADAYIVRSGPSRHLNDAIRYVRDGGKYLAPQLTQDVALNGATTSHEHDEAFCSLRNAFEAQSRTVAKLENAMDRAQNAIELLQQKVEELEAAPAPVETPQPVLQEEPDRGRFIHSVKKSAGAAAAAVMVGCIGFMLAGILQPAPHSPLHDFFTVNAADVPSSLSLTREEIATVDKAGDLLKHQQYAEAEKLCRSLLQQNPANTMASRLLANALSHENRAARF